MWNVDLVTAGFSRIPWSNWHKRLRSKRIDAWIRHLLFDCPVAALVLQGYVTRPRLLRMLSALTLFGVILIGTALIYRYVAEEARTSRLQARYLAELGRELSYRTEPGASDSIRFPRSGPYDVRLGYADLPKMIGKLQDHNYQITRQARLSPRMAELIDRGLNSPYREKVQAGLKVLDCNDQALFSARYPERVYDRFDAVPPLLVNSLLFIENRELLDPSEPKRNPAVEWDRFAKAVLDQGLHLVDSEHETPGGSTLATQIEKYRHSAEGRTASVKDKLRQMASASVRSYLDGEDTGPTRRQIVLDYLNSMPLAAKAGFGEIHGLGDGLWAWYGWDFAEVNRLLPDGTGKQVSTPQATAYKQALSLLVAQRRPSYYLIEDVDDLEGLTNSHLRLLADAGIVSPGLRDAALAVPLKLKMNGASPPPESFVSRKAVSSIRNDVANLLGTPRRYDLDRLDLTLSTTLEGEAQRAITERLATLKNPAAAQAAGLYGYHLLDKADKLDSIRYSFVLFERGEKANYLRVQTDNVEQPFDINEGAKLDLGSTAKLRTLVTYLEIIAALHDRYGALDDARLAAVEVAREDRLTRWAVDYLRHARDKSLAAMLEAAMERRYSANPAEQFFTGGGLHTFENFDHADNGKVLSVREGLTHSVNLVFIRLMRDVVHHYMFQTPGSTARLLEDAGDPRRQDYLARFADREGREFIRRFYRKYEGKPGEEMEATLLQGMRLTPRRLASAYRSIHPDGTTDGYAALVRKYLPDSAQDGAALSRLFEQVAPDRMGLADRGYVAGIHPLELWVVGYRLGHPGATLAQTIEASAAERQAVYVWLTKTHRKNAQDKRILSLLEVEGFLEIHRRWKRLGYPFDSLVPSYATAIGSSADRPAALAELMGIIVNGGMRYPTVRVGGFQFAAGTPYETDLQRPPATGERVLPAEVADTVRSALIDVVERGTARRLKGALTGGDGTPIVIGGKTGTGDHRFNTYDKHGNLVSSRVVNRSATFVFLIGDRLFGTMTVFVPGPQAADYDFTSSLPVQVVKTLAPQLAALANAADGTRSCRMPEGRRSTEHKGG